MSPSAPPPLGPLPAVTGAHPSPLPRSAAGPPAPGHRHVAQIGPLPPQACEWMVRSLRTESPGTEDWRFSALPGQGADALRVRELKLLVNRLEQLLLCWGGSSDGPPPAAGGDARSRLLSRFVRPRSTARKADWVDCLHRFFALRGRGVVPGDVDALYGLLEGDAVASGGGGGGTAAAPGAAAATGPPRRGGGARPLSSYVGSIVAADGGPAPSLPPSIDGRIARVETAEGAAAAGGPAPASPPTVDGRIVRAVARAAARKAAAAEAAAGGPTPASPSVDGRIAGVAARAAARRAAAAPPSVGAAPFGGRAPTVSGELARVARVTSAAHAASAAGAEAKAEARAAAARAAAARRAMASVSVSVSASSVGAGLSGGSASGGKLAALIAARKRAAAAAAVAASASATKRAAAAVAPAAARLPQCPPAPSPIRPGGAAARPPPRCPPPAPSPSPIRPGGGGGDSGVGSIFWPPPAAAAAPGGPRWGRDPSHSGAAGAPGAPTGGPSSAAASARADPRTSSPGKKRPRAPATASTLAAAASAAGAAEPDPADDWLDLVDLTSPSARAVVRGPGGQSAIAKEMEKRVKIKQEKMEPSTSGFFGSTSVGGPDGGDGGGADDSRPRDTREWGMVSMMRTMGFVDVAEMLGGLRHVGRERRGGGGDRGDGEGGTDAGGAAGAEGGEMSPSEQAEAAAMWIVAQREEAEEARKMDAARISSEFVQSEESRRQDDSEKKLHDASVEEIVGAGDDDDDEGAKQGVVARGGHRSKSKFFPLSVVLQSPMVRGIFLSISSDPEKAELIRYLSLERKAYKWYGAVLPWPYFRYTARELFEGWAEGGMSAETLGELLRREADRLEGALYRLSEQQDTGLGNAPKIFLMTREEAVGRGLPDSPVSGSGEEDEVVIVETVIAAAATATQKPAREDVKVGASSVTNLTFAATIPMFNACPAMVSRRDGSRKEEAIEIM